MIWSASLRFFLFSSILPQLELLIDLAIFGQTFYIIAVICCLRDFKSGLSISLDDRHLRISFFNSGDVQLKGTSGGACFILFNSSFSDPAFHGVLPVSISKRTTPKPNISVFSEKYLNYKL